MNYGDLQLLKKTCPLFLYLFLFFFVVESAPAKDLTKDAAAQTENEALQYSRRWNGEALRRSIELYREAAADWEKLGENQKAAACWREAAALALYFSDYKNAFANLQKALRIAEKNNLREEKVLALSYLSRAANQAGRTKDCEKYYKQSLQAAASLDSAAAQAHAFFSAAEYNFYFGSIRETIELYQKALAFADKSNDAKLSGQILLNLGYSYLREGNPVYGLLKVKESLAKSEEIDDKRGQAAAYFGTGFLYTFMDEKQKALDVFQKAEAMFPEDVDQLEKAKLLNGTATIYDEYGEFDLAESYRRRALELYKQSDYPYGQLATLPSLAKSNCLKGDELYCKQLYEEALTLANKLNDTFHQAIIKEALGDLDFQGKSYENAVKNYRAASEVYQKLKIKFPRVENSLGKAFARLGDNALARRYFETALETNIAIKDLSAAAENLYNLAGLNKAEGQAEKSLFQIKESLKTTESLYDSVVNNKLQKSYFSTVFDRYELYINLLMKMHREAPDKDFALQALQAAEKSRARVMLENLSLTEADFTKDADAVAVKREKEIRVLLNAKADKLTDLLSQNADKSETDKVDNEMHELVNELETIKARFKQQSPIYSAIKNPAPFDVGDFQQNILDENSLLLEFSFGEDESYLWLVAKTEVTSYVLPPREEIESSIEVLRGLLKTRELKTDEAIEDFQQRINAAEIKYQSEAAELSRKLFGQIADKLTGKRLIIVPDGALHYFPVAALPLPGSATGEPILLTNETVYEPSAQTLTVLVRSRRQTVPGKNLLVFSDPIFTSDDARFAAEQKPAEIFATETAQTDRFRFAESLNNLPRLAASKDESETITATVGAANIENYSGFTATREKLLSLKTEDYKILHFATHGMTDENHPELSGIVLSRFDEKGGKLNEVFRIQDIYGLNLNADLVVLSACSTGVGKRLKGEGLMSLNNAFLQTGAKSVLASLWKVEDGATLELMRNFYGAMANERLTPSESLRRAQIKLRENPHYKSPFFWAAFTVQGDFRNVPQISGEYGFWIYLLPFMPLPLVGIYLYRRKYRLKVRPARAP
jgi:CHAT domain-containing protein/Flp pilus assembly protein TadD